MIVGRLIKTILELSFIYSQLNLVSFFMNRAQGSGAFSQKEESWTQKVYGFISFPNILEVCCLLIKQRD